MKLRLSLDDIRRTVSAAVAAVVIAGSIGVASPAHAAPGAPAAPKATAAPKAPATLDTARVLKRAKAWTDAKVPYSQTGYKGGYRRDCSGFISMAWDLPENLVTFNMPLVAKRIGKGDLRLGDVLLNDHGGAGGRHVVMFEKWADAKHTKYLALEQTGSVDRAIRHVLPYPYKFDTNLYKPYRYTGMDRYERAIPKDQRQTVAGWAERKADEQRAAQQRAAEQKAAAEKANGATKSRRDPARERANGATVHVRAITMATAPSGFVGGFISWLGL